jgi:anti-sigma B factor antagonist
MTISKTNKNDKTIFEIEGRVDTTTAPQLEEAIKEASGSNSLVLDFSNVEYLSSAGLRVLLMGHKTMAAKGGMKIINAKEDIMEIFEVTGFADILNIE